MRSGSRTSPVPGSPRCQLRQDHEVRHQRKRGSTRSRSGSEHGPVQPVESSKWTLSRKYQENLSVTARRTDSSCVRFVLISMTECSDICLVLVCRHDATFCEFCTKKSLTAALHERFAKPVFCRDRTQVDLPRSSRSTVLRTLLPVS